MPSLLVDMTVGLNAISITSSHDCSVWLNAASISNSHDYGEMLSLLVHWNVVSVSSHDWLNAISISSHDHD